MVQLVSTGEALMERRIAEIPPGGERLEAGRGHRVRLPGDVVQLAAVGVDRYGEVAESGPAPSPPIAGGGVRARQRERCLAVC